MPKRASKSYGLAQVGHDIQIVSHIIYLATWYREGGRALTETGGLSGFQWLQRDGLEVPVRSIPYTTNFKIPSKTYECRPRDIVRSQH